MKTCVVTANYSCDPNKVWLYLTKPTRTTGAAM